MDKLKTTYVAEEVLGHEDVNDITTTVNDIIDTIIYYDTEQKVIEDLEPNYVTRLETLETSNANLISRVATLESLVVDGSEISY